MQLTHVQETKQASDDTRNGKRRRIAVKVWSEMLQAHLWVVADDEDIEVFTRYGLTGKFFTAEELKNLNCMDEDSVKAIHTILLDNRDEASILEKA